MSKFTVLRREITQCACVRTHQSGARAHTHTHAYLETAQMKSIETAHLYLGASSWSTWLTCVNSCKVTSEEI